MTPAAPKQKKRTFKVWVFVPPLARGRLVVMPVRRSSITKYDWSAHNWIGAILTLTKGKALTPSRR